MSLAATTPAIALFSTLVLLGSMTASAASMRHEPAGSVPVTTLKKEPKVPFMYALGQQRFRNKCAACHGEWAEGVKDTGPPLVHPYYRPGHHSDSAFYRAAKSGVKSHHWSFGDMPPVEEITKKDVATILGFLRWWQVQNGIQ